MKLKLTLLFCLAGMIAQGQRGTHTLYAEGLGIGGWYSVNYDKILFASDKAIYSIRIGTAIYYHEVDINKKAIEVNFPLMFNRLKPLKNKKHNFEIGVGIGISWGYRGDELTMTVNREVHTGVTAFIGYRYQKSNGGLMLRAGWNPFYSVIDDWLIWYWPAVGIGYTF